MQVLSVPLESTLAAASQWKKDFKPGFPILFDPKMTIVNAYGVEGLPTNIAIDRNGKIVQVLVGGDSAALEAVVKRMAKK